MWLGGWNLPSRMVSEWYLKSARIRHFLLKMGPWHHKFSQVLQLMARQSSHQGSADGSWTMGCFSVCGNYLSGLICSLLHLFARLKRSLNGFCAGLWQVVYCKAQTFRQYLGRWSRILVLEPQGPATVWAVSSGCDKSQAQWSDPGFQDLSFLNLCMAVTSRKDLEPTRLYTTYTNIHTY